MAAKWVVKVKDAYTDSLMHLFLFMLRDIWTENPFTMGQNRKKLRKNSHLIIYFPTSLGMSKMSEQANK